MTDPSGDITEPGLEKTDPDCEELGITGDVTEPVEEATEPGDVILLTDSTEPG